MSYLDTLRRIPEDIFLAIFAQDFDEEDNACCVCGWAVREQIARCLNTAPEATALPTTQFCGSYFSFDHEVDSYLAARDKFGGSEQEWKSLWIGAIDHTPRLERAVVDRLNEIVDV